MKNKTYYITENVNDLFKIEGKYEEQMDSIENYIYQDIERRHEKCLIDFGNGNIEINLGQYLAYLIILEPFYVFDEEIQPDVLPDVSNIPDIEKYLDWCIDYFGIQLNYVDEIGEILVDITDRINKVTCEMTKQFGPTFDLHTFIKLAERNPDFEKILYHPDEYIKERTSVTPDEIIKHTHKIVDEIQECIVNDDQNYFKNFITSGAGINSRQLGQVLGYIGLKPDLKEKIIPKSIDTNFCMGLRNITDFYINAVGCLKALITVKIQTKNSGYLTRKLQILLEDEFISDVEDCGTKHLLPFEVKTKTHLSHINNLYYSIKSNGKNLKRINSNNKDLIGKTIYLRTPITCACKDGICKKCYGHLYKFNKDMNVGVIASLIITNMITQTNLSVKHLLQAAILKNLNPEIQKYFTVEIDKLSIKDEYIDKISLVFSKDVISDEDNQEYSISNISLIDGNKLIEIENNIIFNINPEINEIIIADFNKDLDKYVVKGKKLKNFDYIFNYSVENNSLSGPMLKLKELIEKNEFIRSHNAFELFDRIVEILIESKSKTDYIHIALMIKNLMAVENGRESFTKNEFPEYTLYSVPDAIHYCSKSVAKPLLFERIKDQLLLDKYGTLDKKGYSNYDVLLK